MAGLEGWAQWAGAIVALVAAIYGIIRQRQDIKAIIAKEKRESDKDIDAAANERIRLRAEIEEQWLSNIREEMSAMRERIVGLEKENQQLRSRLAIEIRSRDERIAVLEARVAHLEAENKSLSGHG